jgi:hypothetical protein
VLPVSIVFLVRLQLRRSGAQALELLAKPSKVKQPPNQQGMVCSHPACPVPIATRKAGAWRSEIDEVFHID